MRTVVGNKSFDYYVKGRVFEWTMAIAMFLAGLELLIWDASFGPAFWLSQVLGQKWIGSILFFTGWIRISSLMFNGQLLFGYRIGFGVRAVCAIVAATLWAQFVIALVAVSVSQGVPSVGLPFWIMFTIAELVVVYSIGEEWKK